MTGTAASRWVNRSSSAVDAFANVVCAVLTAVCASSTALIAVWHAVRSSAGGVVVVVVGVGGLGADVGADGDGGVERGWLRC